MSRNDALSLAKAAVDADAKGKVAEAISLYEQTVEALFSNMSNTLQADVLQRKTDEYMERIEILRKSLPTQPEAHKICGVCTYKNSAHAVSCEICNSPDLRDAISQTACPTCTFANSPGSATCKMCGAGLGQRPPPPPASRSSMQQSAASVANVVDRLEAADRDLALRAKAKADARAAEAADQRLQAAAAQAQQQAAAAAAQAQQQATAAAKAKQDRDAAAAAAARRAAAKAQQEEMIYEQRVASARAQEEQRRAAAEQQQAAARQETERRAFKAAAEAKLKQEKAAAEHVRKEQEAAALVLAQKQKAGKLKEALARDMFTAERKGVDEAVIHQKALKERDFALAKNQSSCKDCKSGFSMLRWRKRCGYCGYSMCSSCLTHTAVLPQCFGHGATMQAVCSRCNHELISLHHRMLDQLQALAGQSVFQQNDDDAVLISTRSSPPPDPYGAPPESSQPIPSNQDVRDGLGMSNATLNFAQACLANDTGPYGDDSPSSSSGSPHTLPLGFGRSDLVEVKGVPLPAFRVGSDPSTHRAGSDLGISRSSSFRSCQEQEDELPLGFARPDLEQRKQEMVGMPLPEFRNVGPMSPAQKIKHGRHSGGLEQLPLGFLRHDLEFRPGVELPDFNREDAEELDVLSHSQPAQKRI